MTPKQLNRLETLLHLSWDKTASANERELAHAEAVRIVRASRAGDPDDVWCSVILMRFEECWKCGEKISPAQRAWYCKEKYMHEKCKEQT